MNLTIKQYEYEKKEVDSKVIELPTETTYYFETGIRRSIRIIPRFTTWNKRRFNKEEELYLLDITCLYDSFENKAERFTINISELENIYYSENLFHKDIITAFIDGWLEKRTKEQFEKDLETTISKLTSD